MCVCERQRQSIYIIHFDLLNQIIYLPGFEIFRLIPRFLFFLLSICLFGILWKANRVVNAINSGFELIKLIIVHFYQYYLILNKIIFLIRIQAMRGEAFFFCHDLPVGIILGTALIQFTLFWRLHFLGWYWGEPSSLRPVLTEGLKKNITFFS